jgi:DNA-binding transcriptional ArsR family regulator
VHSVSDQSYVHLSPNQLTTLAHPLRHRILSALRSDGPATSTIVAERLGSNSGKTSYHLRVLADAGLVVEDSERGNARDRWWRAAHDVTVFEPHWYADDPEAVAAARYLMGSAASFYAAQLEQWLTTQHEWSPEWIEAAEMSDLKLRLTAEELKEMNAEILGVVERHAAASSQPARSAAADAAAVDCLVIINSFPNPRPVL